MPQNAKPSVTPLPRNPEQRQILLLAFFRG